MEAKRNMPAYAIIFQEQLSRGLTDFQFCLLRKYGNAAAWEGFMEFVRVAEEGNNDPLKGCKKIHALEMVRFKEIGNNGLEIELVATNPHLPEFFISNRKVRLDEVVRREIARRAALMAAEAAEREALRRKGLGRFWWLKDVFRDMAMRLGKLTEPLRQQT
ncbi:hypothetical protein D4R51_01755 [bacterium]|nr:MAG: hypothetical protein D4R51_01755 [bacterium]